MFSKALVWSLSDFRDAGSRLLPWSDLEDHMRRKRTAVTGEATVSFEVSGKPWEAVLP